MNFQKQKYTCEIKKTINVLNNKKKVNQESIDKLENVPEEKIQNSAHIEVNKIQYKKNFIDLQNNIIIKIQLIRDSEVYLGKRKQSKRNFQN